MGFTWVRFLNGPSKPGNFLEKSQKFRLFSKFSKKKFLLPVLVNFRAESASLILCGPPPTRGRYCDIVHQICSITSSSLFLRNFENRFFPGRLSTIFFLRDFRILLGFPHFPQFSPNFPNFSQFSKFFPDFHNF